MGSVTIDGLMEGFSSLLHHANPSAMPEFMAWVDRKVSEYKMSHVLSVSEVGSQMPMVNTGFHFNNSQLAKDMNRIKTLISDSNQKKETSHHSSVNLSSIAIEPLGNLLATNYAGPKNSITLKVPCVSPTHSYTCYNSPISSTGSPQAGSTFMKNEGYFTLMNDRGGSTARANLSQEFDEHIGSDTNCGGEDFGQQKTRIDCHLCGKLFLHRSSYRRHMRLHQGVFTHHCKACDRKFTRKEHFERHKCGRKSFGKDRNDLDSSFDSVTDSPVKLEYGWYDRPPPMALPDEPRPLDMSSKTYLDASEDTNDASSISSGSQISPQQGDECSRRMGRKSSAPRKIECKSFPENDDFMSDIDESMYEPPQLQTTDDELVIDMSVKKKSNNMVDSPKSVNQPRPQHKSFTHECAMSIVSNLQTERGFGVPPESGISPPPGFRIADLIENTITKYHSALESDNTHVPYLLKHDGSFSQQAQIPSSPKMKAKMYAKMYVAAETADAPKPLPKAEEVSQKGNFLATETGTYQITTEDIDSDGVVVENCSSKVIKVVKQGNYLKLKKEAQLIDGELRFICPHCNKVFHRSSNFSRHMRIHRGVFSYICSTCHRGFYRKEHFDKHKCYRKSMATTWERKTKVDLDRDVPEKCDKENDCSGGNIDKDRSTVNDKMAAWSVSIAPVSPNSEFEKAVVEVEGGTQ